MAAVVEPLKPSAESVVLAKAPGTPKTTSPVKLASSADPTVPELVAKNVGVGGGCAVSVSGQ